MALTHLNLATEADDGLLRRIRLLTSTPQNAGSSYPLLNVYWSYQILIWKPLCVIIAKMVIPICRASLCNHWRDAASGNH